MSTVKSCVIALSSWSDASLNNFIRGNYRERDEELDRTFEINQSFPTPDEAQFHGTKEERFILFLCKT